MMSQTPALDVLFEHMVDGVYLIDPETSKILWCNRAGYAELGLSAAEVLNQSILSLQKDASDFPQWTEIAQVIRSTPAYTFVGRYRHKEGGEIAVEVKITRFSHDGRDYFLSVARNINPRIAAEQRLTQNEQRNWYVLHESMDGLWDWDIVSDEIFFSPKLKQTLGYSPTEIEPNVETWRNNIHPEDHERVFAALQQHMQGKSEHYEAEYRLRNRHGLYIWVDDRGKVTDYNPQGQPLRMIGMMHNITDRKLLELHLENLAHIDDLTQLPNRRAGMSQLNQMLLETDRKQQSLCLGVVDIDHFKAINDQYGHPVGDKVLANIAAVMRKHLRKGDYVFRLGGEEFVFILPDTHAGGVQRVEAGLHACMREVDWAQIFGIAPVTLSIGIACYPNHTLDHDRLLPLADSALYEAKAQGRNRTCFINKEG